MGQRDNQAETNSKRTKTNILLTILEMMLQLIDLDEVRPGSLKKLWVSVWFLHSCRVLSMILDKVHLIAATFDEKSVISK